MTSRNRGTPRLSHGRRGRLGSATDCRTRSCCRARGRPMRAIPLGATGLGTRRLLALGLGLELVGTPDGRDPRHRRDRAPVGASPASISSSCVWGTSRPAATVRMPAPFTRATSPNPITSTASRRGSRQDAGTRAWVTAHATHLARHTPMRRTPRRGRRAHSRARRSSAARTPGSRDDERRPHGPPPHTCRR